MPECPLEWDQELTVAENRAREGETCPVNAMDTDTYLLEELDPDVATSTTLVLAPTSPPKPR